jgi:hypothetical protein
VTLAAYVLSIVLVNAAFAVLPMLDTPLGPLSPASFLVGGIFVLRDYAQREIGHRVLFATLVGIGISYAMASPQVATASALAFGCSEILDWLVFTLAKRRTFRERVLLSHTVSVPADTAVFLAGLGFLTWAGFAAQVIAKSLVLVLLARRSRALDLVGGGR